MSSFLPFLSFSSLTCLLYSYFFPGGPGPRAAARLGAELGADFIKAPYCDDYGTVTSSTFVPVVILGGAKGDERSMLSDIHEAIASGAKGVAITAKDKLRKQLGRNLDIAGGSINFSSEKADQCTLEQNGIENVLEFVGLPLPDVYSADLSIFVLEAGIKILEHHRPDIMYLSTTDYVQHKYAPGSPEINDLYSKLDTAFGRLVDLGAVVGVTADHGMNDKSKLDGTPKIIFLQDE